MKDGYIKIYRSLFDNDIWNKKPFSDGQAWIDLLQLANIKDSTAWLSKGNVEVKRGQVFRSIKELSDRWGWSSKKTIGFMKRLENAKMVVVKGLAQGTLITITNYTLYNTLGQESGVEEDRAEGKQRASRGQRNKKERKKERKNIYSPDAWINEIVPEELRAVFLEWSSMRDRIKKPITSRLTVQRAYNSLVRLSKNPKTQIKIVEQSIDRCWAGFYEIKDRETIMRYKEFTTQEDTKKEYVPMPKGIEERLGDSLGFKRGENE